MNKIFVCFFTFTISFLLHAKIYQCELNLAQPGQEIKESEVEKYLKRTTFDSASEAGRLLKVQNIESKIWQKNGSVYVILASDEGQKIRANFHPEQPQIGLKWNDNIDFSCQGVAAAGKQDTVDYIMKDRLDLDDDLKRFRGNLQLIVEKPWRMVYEQVNANDKMRLAIFQLGRNFTADENYDKNTPHCRFNVRMKVEEDVFVPRYAKFAIKSIALNEYNNNLVLLSYSFVDPSEAKTEEETTELIPFNMECLVVKGAPFTYRDFRKLVGKRIQIELFK